MIIDKSLRLNNNIYPKRNFYGKCHIPSPHLSPSERHSTDLNESKLNSLTSFNAQLVAI